MGKGLREQLLVGTLSVAAGVVGFSRLVFWIWAMRS